MTRDELLKLLNEIKGVYACNDDNRGIYIQIPNTTAPNLFYAASDDNLLIDGYVYGRERTCEQVLTIVKALTDK